MIGEPPSVFVYHGGSMLGTFCPGDRLTLDSLAICAVHCGDVVAFLRQDSAGKEKKWAHRVVRKTPAGMLTRGDNNSSFDSQLLTADRLLGKVIQVERNGAVKPVQGGWAGLLRARALWMRIHLKSFLVTIGRTPYRLLRKSGLLPRMWQPEITRLKMNTDEGELIKFVSKGRTVAYWWPGTGRFECRWPFDLVVFPSEVSIDQEKKQ